MTPMCRENSMGIGECIFVVGLVNSDYAMDG